MDSRRLGTALMAASVLLLVSTLVVGAALAPETGTVGADDDDRTLVGVQGGGAGFHEYGSVLLLDGRSEAWRVDDADSYFDVTMLDNGSVLAGFMDGGRENCGPYASPCSRTGFQVISPSPSPRVVAEYSFPVRGAGNSEAHDVEPLDGGGYLVSDMEHERLRVVENGTVTWSWNASDHYDPPADATRVDWLHINDVDVVGEGRYLVSVRNANQLVVVERGEGVVETINADHDDGDDGACTTDGLKQFQQLHDTDGDGDIRCGDPTVLDHQHNPQWLGDGAVLVADSENDRIVELHRGDDGNWSVAWSLSSANGVALDWPRDADRLSNGNTLVTDSFNRRVVEVNESGAANWSYRTERIPYEAERLPEGETVGAMAYSSPGEGGALSQDLPVVTPTLVLLRTMLPVPFWVSELHVLAGLCSVVGFAVGARLRVGRTLPRLRRSDD
jgi:hypothetical protein